MLVLLFYCSNLIIYKASVEIRINRTEVSIFEQQRKSGMIKAYISLGGNTGNRFKIQQNAIENIANRAGNVVAQSYLYETAPWGFEHDQDFLNQVIAINTSLSPTDLMDTLMEIEKELGRTRTEGSGYEARSIDLDVLFYGDREVRESKLRIPHPRLHKRRFILIPLNDIARELMHPVLQQTIAELLIDCLDELPVNRYKELQN
jgi:2-amino-4-hydroxy-6-hydroxymethyldihydropteridine diphosphokinase